MNITRLALNRPVTTIMVFLCCVVLGGVTAFLLPLEKFPEVEFPGMFVQIPYEGSTPEEIERLITKPAEEVLATISDIKRMHSQSSESGTEIFMEFDWGIEVSIKGVEAREKLDGIMDQFPADLERYFVHMWSTTDMELLQFRISSNRELSNAYDLLNRNLKRRVERLEGVGRVELYGVEQKEIRIDLLQDRVTAHRVDLGQLYQTLNSGNFSLSAGRITDGNRRFVVRPVGEYRTIEDIENVLIGQGAVRLRDIARVTYDTPELDYGRHLDQKYAVGLDVFKASGHNTVAVARRVMNEIRAIGEDPQMEGITLLTFEDQAESVISSLKELLRSGMLGAFLAFFVLFFFLRQLATTLIVALAVPVSILVTLVFLYFFGLSLNILSLMGLMLAIGMLVDNAVVITESIHQRQLKDSNVANATVRGVKDVAMAVTAGTLTTAIVFLPAIISPKDQITLFMKHVAIAIIIALVASLIIAQTVIPLLTSRLKPPKEKPNVVDKIVERYGAFLGWTLRHRGIAVTGILVILASVAVPVKFVDNDMFPEEDARRIRLFYNLNGSFTVERVEEAVDEIEAFLFDNQEDFEIASVYSYYNTGWASSSIYLTEDDFDKSSDEIKELIRAGLPKIAIGSPSFEFSEGMGGAEGVSISLRGESSEVLFALSQEAARVLSGVEGLKDVRSEADLGAEEVHVAIDRDRAAQVGMSSENVARAVSVAMRGTNLRRIKGEDGEIDVRLAFQDSDKATLENLQNISLVNDTGTQTQLASIADFRVIRGPQEIRRTDRQTVLSVNATLDDITVPEAREKITAVMDRFVLPAGYSWTFGRRFEREEETQQIMLINLLMALVLIYLVMAGLFESLITPAAIWTSIIFAIVGVYWFFLATSTTFSVMAWIGILILIGIVVNNGIVLLDHVLQLRAEGYDRVSAIVEGGKNRLRPILMTAGTTVLGLVPLCIGTTQIGGDGPPYFPMARAIVGGLTFSTIITLIVLPTIYILLDDLRNWARRVVRVARA